MEKPWSNPARLYEILHNCGTETYSMLGVKNAWLKYYSIPCMCPTSWVLHGGTKQELEKSIVALVARDLGLVELQIFVKMKSKLSTY